MELRHLRYVVAVAEQRHFGRAARSLHISQPPLSQAVRQLEDELQVELFERTTRTVALTPAGEVFVADARRTLAALDDTVERTRRIARGQVGVLRIALTGSATYGYLPRMAALVKARMPGVGLQIQTDRLTPQQVHDLDAGRIDVGVLRLPVRDDRLTTRLVAREPLVLALPSGHRLVDDPEVTVDALVEESFVVLAPSARSVVTDAVVRTCLDAGFYLTIEHEVTEMSTLLSLVAGGLGIALVPASTRASGLEGVTFADLPGTATVDLALAWRADQPNPLVEAFVQTLEEHDLLQAAPDRKDPR